MHTHSPTQYYMWVCVRIIITFKHIKLFNCQKFNFLKRMSWNSTCYFLQRHHQLRSYMEQTKFKPIQIVAACFTEMEADRWICKLCVNEGAHNKLIKEHIKKRPRLSALTSLCPEIRNTARCGSTFLFECWESIWNSDHYWRKLLLTMILKAKISAVSGVDKDVEKWHLSSKNLTNYRCICRRNRLR